MFANSALVKEEDTWIEFEQQVSNDVSIGFQH